MILSSPFSCWLSTEQGLIWAFVGPAMFVVLVSWPLIFLVQFHVGRCHKNRSTFRVGWPFQKQHYRYHPVWHHNFMYLPGEPHHIFRCPEENLHCEDSYRWQRQRYETQSQVRSKTLYTWSPHLLVAIIVLLLFSSLSQSHNVERHCYHSYFGLDLGLWGVFHQWRSCVVSVCLLCLQLITGTFLPLLYTTEDITYEFDDKSTWQSLIYGFYFQGLFICIFHGCCNRKVGFNELLQLHLLSYAKYCMLSIEIYESDGL